MQLAFCFVSNYFSDEESDIVKHITENISRGIFLLYIRYVQLLLKNRQTSFNFQ